MSKHTPGPWNFAGPYLNTGPHPTTNTVTLLGPVKENGGQTVLGHLYFNDPRDLEREKQFHANATLIAAAPEMLKALKMVYGSLRARGYVRIEDSDLIRDAIAKAEGRS